MNAPATATVTPAGHVSRYSEYGIEFQVYQDSGMSCWPPCWSGELPKLEAKGEGLERTWWVTLNIEGLSLLASFIEDGIQVKVQQGQLTIKVYGGYEED